MLKSQHARRCKIMKKLDLEYNSTDTEKIVPGYYADNEKSLEATQEYLPCITDCSCNPKTHKFLMMNLIYTNCNLICNLICVVLQTPKKSNPAFTVEQISPLLIVEEPADIEPADIVGISNKLHLNQNMRGKVDSQSSSQDANNVQCIKIQHSKPDGCIKVEDHSDTDNFTQSLLISEDDDLLKYRRKNLIRPSNSKSEFFAESNAVQNPVKNIKKAFNSTSNKELNQLYCKDTPRPTQAASKTRFPLIAETLLKRDRTGWNTLENLLQNSRIKAPSQAVSNTPKFVYEEVVRDKERRQKMHAESCPCCEGVTTPIKTIQQKLCIMSLITGVISTTS